MRILDQNNDKSLDNILLLLTIDEAKELRDDLVRLLMQKTDNDHGHINDISYSKEITVSLYEQNKIKGFNDRIRKLIVDDK
jgi:hypothetical protein